MNESANSPEESLCESDTGDDVQRRFRYQATCIAEVCISLLSDSCELAELYCEHFEDLLIKRKDNLFIGVQIKTRETGEMVKSTDPSVIKSLQRFLQWEADFPNQFAAYSLVVNTAFWQLKDNTSNLAYLVRFAQSTQTTVPKAIDSYINRIAPPSSPNRHLVLSMLRKLRLQPSANINEIFNSVVEHIGKLDNADQRPYAAISRAATHLVNAIMQASALPPIPSRHFLSFFNDPEQTHVRETLAAKRITRQTVFQILLDVLCPLPIATAIPPAPLLITLQEQMVALSAQLADVSPPNATAAERVYDAKLDVVRDLLQHGQSVEARLAIEQVQREMATAGIDPPKRLSARIENNLGACAFDSMDWEAAVLHFRRAHELDPLRAASVGNEAAVALLRRDFEEARRLAASALAIDPQEPNSAATYIQALHDLGLDDEMERFIASAPWVRDDPVCAAALGLIYHNSGREAEGEQLLRLALTKAPENAHIYITLASTIIWPIQERLLAANAPLPPLSAEQRTRLEDALQILTQAVERSERHANHMTLHAALVSRAAVHTMLGSFEQGIRDCDRVLVDDTDHLSALENKGRLLTHLERPLEAVQCFEAVLRGYSTDRRSVFVTRHTDDDQAAIARLLACAYLQVNQAERVPAILTPFWNPVDNRIEQLGTAEVLLIAYANLQNIEEVDRLLECVATMWPDNPRALAVQGHALARIGRLDAATDRLDQARNQSSGPLYDFITLQLADHLYMQGTYERAASLFAEVVDVSQDSLWLRKYVVSLMNSGQFKTALTVTQTLRSGQDPVPVLGEVEAKVLEFIGDLRGARELYRALANSSPQDVRNRLRGAALDLRMGEHESARHEIERIQFDEIANDANDLMTVAQMRTALQMPDALPYAYAAKLLEPSSLDIQLAYYFGVVLHREAIDKDILEPTRVGPNCVVHLKSAQDERTYRVVEGRANLESNEITLSDRLGLLLMDHIVGDSVSITPELAYTITEIQSIYVYSFQQFSRDFAIHFEATPSFRQYQVRDDDISEMLAVVDERHRVVTSIMDLYRQRNLPLHVVARHLGKSLSDMWEGITHGGTEKLLVATGTTEDGEREDAWAKEASGLVLDTFAILTILHLDIVAAIKKRFTTLYVSQWTFDEIMHQLVSDVGSAPTGSIGKIGSQYFLNEPNADLHEKRRQTVEAMRDFVRTETTIMPANLFLDLSDDERTQVEQTLGKNAIGAILVAKELDCLFYCDDLVLRFLANRTWNVKECGCQAILKELRRSGVMCEDEYARAIVTLVQANYSHIVIDPDLLIRLLELDFYRITPAVRSAFALYSQSECNEDATVRAMSEVVKRVWPRAMLDLQRALVLDLVLETLARRRSDRTLIRKFLVFLPTNFRLMTHYLPEIVEHIRLWVQQHPA